MIEGGKLIATGSNSCVFQPNLPCQKNQNTTHTRISKIIYDKEADTIVQEERKQTELITNIKGHKQWALVFDTFCNTPKYSFLKKYDEEGLNDCFPDKKPSSLERDFDNYRSKMLSGSAGGLTILQYFTHNFSEIKSIKGLESEFIKLIVISENSLQISILYLPVNDICNIYKKKQK